MAKKTPEQKAREKTIARSRAENSKLYLYYDGESYCSMPDKDHLDIGVVIACFKNGNEIAV